MVIMLGAGSVLRGAAVMGSGCMWTQGLAWIWRAGGTLRYPATGAGRLAVAGSSGQPRPQGAILARTRETWSNLSSTTADREQAIYSLGGG